MQPASTPAIYRPTFFGGIPRPSHVALTASGSVRQDTDPDVPRARQKQVSVCGTSRDRWTQRSLEMAADTCRGDVCSRYSRLGHNSSRYFLTSSRTAHRRLCFFAICHRSDGSTWRMWLRARFRPLRRKRVPIVLIRCLRSCCYLAFATSSHSTVLLCRECLLILRTESRSWTTSASPTTLQLGHASDWTACSPVCGCCISTTATASSPRARCSSALGRRSVGRDIVAVADLSCYPPAVSDLDPLLSLVPDLSLKLHRSQDLNTRQC